jgi:hypothetical protein
VVVDGVAYGAASSVVALEQHQDGSSGVATWGSYQTKDERTAIKGNKVENNVVFSALVDSVTV